MSFGIAACGDDEPKASSAPASASASPRTPSNPKLDEVIAADTAALEKMGFEPEPTAAASAKGGILRVGLVSVYYFNNVKDAKAAKREFASGEESAGTRSKIVRVGTHVLVADFSVGAKAKAELDKLADAYEQL